MLNNEKLVFVLGPHFPKKPLENLEKIAKVELLRELKEGMGKATSVNAIIEARNEPINRHFLKKAKNLKIIAKYGLGYDNIDVDFATKRKIFVTITRNAKEEETVADLTVGLLIASARRIVEAHTYIKSGRWDYYPSLFQKESLGTDVFDGTLGIVGLGKIGSLVARRAKAFKMKLCYYDAVRRKKIEKKFGIEYTPLDELIKKSDFITFHVPLTKKTYRLFGEREFKLLKPTAYLVNTARAEIFDKKILLNMLKEKRLAGVALDVFHEEPLPKNSQILKMDNVLFTPHMGASTKECLGRMAEAAVGDVFKVLSGKIPAKVNIVNPELLRTR